MSEKFHFQMTVLPLDLEWKNVKRAIILETKNYLEKYHHLLDKSIPEGKRYNSVKLKIVIWYFDNWYVKKLLITETIRREKKQNFIAYMMAGPENEESIRKKMHDAGQLELGLKF